MTVVLIVDGDRVKVSGWTVLSENKRLESDLKGLAVPVPVWFKEPWLTFAVAKTIMESGRDVNQVDGATVSWPPPSEPGSVP